MRTQNLDLHVEKDSKFFYEDRYSKGYMEEWPIEKKQRVFEVIKDLNLPEYGEALDFGCGNGVFTDVLRAVLPKWKIYGNDISELAISNAIKRFPECIFFVKDDDRFKDKKFNFIFSHHVLEHVFDIEGISKQINELATENAHMLHIFPCGNPGSYDYEICLLRQNGIDKTKGNRFFFEDEGHVRRMTTEECARLFSQYKFELTKGYYSNQYYGSINWITRSKPFFVVKMFNPFKGKNIASGIKMTMLLIKFSIMTVLRFIALQVERLSKIKKRTVKQSLVFWLFWLPSKITKPLDEYVKNMAKKEWDQLKHQKNGSEMYLFFTR